MADIVVGERIEIVASHYPTGQGKRPGNAAVLPPGPRDSLKIEPIPQGAPEPSKEEGERKFISASS